MLVASWKWSVKVAPPAVKSPLAKIDGHHVQLEIREELPELQELLGNGQFHRGLQQCFAA